MVRPPAQPGDPVIESPRGIIRVWLYRFKPGTKWESEKRVGKLLEDSVVARTMILYGFEPHVRPNFVTWLISRLREKEKVSVVTDQYGNPTLADELAGVLWKLLAAPIRGVLHAAGREWIHRFDFACRIAECFNLDGRLIERTTSDRFKQPAPRPLKSGLLCERLKADLGIEMLSVSEGLEEMRRRWERP